MAEASSTFILRLWIGDESDADGHPRGRGRIDHLQSREYAYFERLADALVFVQQHFGAYDILFRPASTQPATPRQREESTNNLEGKTQ